MTVGGLLALGAGATYRVFLESPTIDRLPYGQEDLLVVLAVATWLPIYAVLLLRLRGFREVRQAGEMIFDASDRNRDQMKRTCRVGAFSRAYWVS